MEECEILNGSCVDSRSTFTPIKELAQTDGDISLIFLSNDGIHYTEPVEDEWYSAHRTTNDTLRENGYSDQKHYYLSDETASVLGCKEQYQSCDPTLPTERGCSSLNGIASISFNNQMPTTKREISLYWGLGIYAIYQVLNFLRSSALTSRFSLAQGIQAPLPADQWQREVEYWHNIVLAALQGASVDDAVGPGNSEMLKLFWTKPTNDVERHLCSSQVSFSSASPSFNY